MKLINRCVKSNNETSTIRLSTEIAKEAHAGQKRVNGEDYFYHPHRCYSRYCSLVNAFADALPNTSRLYELGIPFEGVQEVCLLHDVIEDSKWTIDNIEKRFIKIGKQDYFVKYIKEPLSKITHNKEMDYPSYIKICMENPTSALCKMLDLEDNLDVFSLDVFDEKNYQRAQGYLSYIHFINSKYKFIEKFHEYSKSI